MQITLSAKLIIATEREKGQQGKINATQLI